MATIVTRQTGPGAKNAALTNAELDQNFINLNIDKLELAQVFSSALSDSIPYFNNGKTLITSSSLIYDGTSIGLGITPQAYTSGSRVLEINGLANNSEIRLTNTATGHNVGSGGLAIRQVSHDSYIWNAGTGKLSLGAGNTSVLEISNTGAVTISGNTVLTTNNYSTYALPLGGGTLTGQVTFSHIPSNYVIAKTIDPRGVWDGVLNGYLLLAKAYVSGLQLNSEVTGTIYLSRGDGGAGRRTEIIEVSSKSAYSSENFLVNWPRGRDFTTGALHKVTYNGTVYHAIRLSQFGGGPYQGFSFSGHTVNAGLVVALDSEVTGVTSYGNSGYLIGLDGIFYLSKQLVLGTFPNSTTNSGEAWIGRAADRNTGTMTVQLGTSNTSRQFEVVDYAWTTVLFSANSNGTAAASNDFRAPIFYDSNDTGYYANPAGISSFYGLAIRGDSSSTDSQNQIFLWGTGDTTTSAIGFKANGGEFPNPTGFGDGYNTYLTMDTDGRGWVFRRGVGGTDFNSAYNAGWILNNGIAQFNASTRSPIFYDSNDTAYYLDPRSASRLSGLRLDGVDNQASGDDGILWINKPNNNDWAILLSGGYDYGLDLRMAASHSYAIRALANNSEYSRLGTDLFYHNSNIRSPIFYDSNDTGYYCDPNSTTRLSTLNVVGSISVGVGQNSSDIYFTDSDEGTRRMHCNSNRVGFLNDSNNWGSYCGDGGDWYSDQSVRSPIFYDNNDTGYYSDQASTSRYNYVVPNRIKLVNNVNNEPRWDFSAYVVEAQHWYGNNSSMTMYLGEGNPVQIPGTPRAPIFYDYNDTNYYIDPNSTSNLNALTLGGRSTTYAMHYAGFTLDANTMPTNSTGFTYSVNAPCTGPIAGFSTGGGYDMQLNANYGNSERLAVRTRQGDGGYWNSWRWVMLENTWINDKYFSSDGIIYSNSSFRAPIFYDSNDTGYYCDPNGTNRLNFVNSNNHYIQSGYMLYSDHGSWQGEYNKIQWHASHLYLQNNGGGYLLILRRGDGGERFYCDYNGNVTASGNITAYSDVRLKKNIQTINKPLDLVKQLRGVTFDWIETNKHSYGLIAQEVEKVIPELVMETVSGTTDADSKTTVKSVDYSKLVSVLIEAVKELNQKVVQLESKLGI